MQDEELIIKARKTPYVLWQDISTLIDQASSTEAINELKSIQRRKELREEYSADCL